MNTPDEDLYGDLDNVCNRLVLAEKILGEMSDERLASGIAEIRIARELLLDVIKDIGDEDDE